MAKEIITRELVLSGLGIVLALFLASAAIVGRKKFWAAFIKSKNDGNPYSGNEGFAAGAIVIPIICGIAATIIGSLSVVSFVQALVSPRLVILNYIRHLL